MRPEVGKRYRCAPAGKVVLCLAVGKLGWEYEYSDGSGWARYGESEPIEEIPSYPERWMNIYNDFVGEAAPSRATADMHAMHQARIGVLHLFPDGHTEMEAP